MNIYNYNNEIFINREVNVMDEVESDCNGKDIFKYKNRYTLR